MPASSDPPRTLTQMLREWDDARLTKLLLDRPDLAFPQPSDHTQVASRATTRHSVSSALDTLNAFELEVARRVSTFTAGVSAADLGAGLDAVAAIAALRRLHDLALVWGPATSLRPVRALSALLAGPGPTVAPAPYPPSFADAPCQPSALVDKVAAGSAFEFVRRIEVLVEHCAHLPLRLLRDGGFASREVRVVAALLDVPAAAATVHLAVAEVSGLLGVAAHGNDEVLLPSSDFDGWLDLPLAEQWAVLATSWSEAHDEAGPRWLKRLCLEAFGDPADGRVLSTHDLRAWVAWHRPRQAAATERQVARLLDHGSWLGVTGLGAVASFAPHLTHPPYQDCADTTELPGQDLTALARHLPTRSGHVLVQADLTAIAPGPLTAAASRELGTLADVESRGGATVYRFTAESLERAMDLGWDAEAILGLLRARSRTGLPQPLEYLVRDLARRRSSDLTRRRTHHLTGRRTEAGAGARPAARQQAAQRGRPRVGFPDQSAGGGLTPAVAAATVDRLRKAEAATPRRGKPDQPAPEPMGAAPVDALREAAETGEVIWISLVDAQGATSERLIRAAEVVDGQVHAHDARCGDEVVVPLRRVTAAHIVRNGR